MRVGTDGAMVARDVNPTAGLINMQYAEQCSDCTVSEQRIIFYLQAVISAQLNSWAIWEGSMRWVNLRDGEIVSISQLSLLMVGAMCS